MIGRYLCCKERFRINVVEGLKVADKFEARIEFGNMWHAMEEAHAADKPPLPALTAYAKTLTAKYPFQQEQVQLWYEKARTMFPYYVDHWARQKDVLERTPLLQEQTFDVPYQLPSGRTVRLRGKWDSVDLIGKGKEAGVWLQENKTKSGIDEQEIRQLLSFDLQTMLYIIAFNSWEGGIRENDVVGVRYNVVRRSDHKIMANMVKKIEEDMAAGRVGEWFARWKMPVSQEDIAKFKRECLDPVLENLCDDYEWWISCKGNEGWEQNSPFDLMDRIALFPDHHPRHFRFPYGVYNPLTEGGRTDLDHYLEDGSTVGLQRVDNLFPELQ